MGIGCFDGFSCLFCKGNASLVWQRADSRNQENGDDASFRTRDSPQSPALRADAAPIPLEDMFPIVICLAARYVGSISLCQICTASSSLRSTVKCDLRTSRIFQHRPYFVACPHIGPWGLTTELEALIQDGATACCDAYGAVVIGSCGLRRGRAAFHFSMQNFPGSLVGVTTLSPDSKFDFSRVVGTHDSLLCSSGGGVLCSASDIHLPPFTHWPIPPETLVKVIFTLGVEIGVVSIEIQAGDGLRWELRRDFNHLGRSLFPVVVATHFAQSLEVLDGRVMYHTAVA